MDKDQLAKMIADKVDAAFKAGEHPKKFFITENGRGVVDGGDLYNAVLADALGVVKVALVDIFQELLTKAQTQAPASATAPAAKTLDKPARSSSKK